MVAVPFASIVTWYLAAVCTYQSSFAATADSIARWIASEPCAVSDAARAEACHRALEDRVLAPHEQVAAPHGLGQLVDEVGEVVVVSLHLVDGCRGDRGDLVVASAQLVVVRVQQVEAVHEHVLDVLRGDGLVLGDARDVHPAGRLEDVHERHGVDADDAVDVAVGPPRGTSRPCPRRSAGSPPVALTDCQILRRLQRGRTRRASPPAA